MEKPILFNTEMVKAILEGKKSCTRRVVKPHRQANIENMWIDMSDWDSVVVYDDNYNIGEKGYIKIPCKVGDILYVRETWCDTTKDLNDDLDLEVGECRYIFKVDDNGHRQPIIEVDVKRWRPSIHMPKEAARIFLEVIDVRVERLQDITTEGCFNEGIKYDYNSQNNEFDTFAELWNSTIKKNDLDIYSWNTNPWVWVIEFKKLENKKD